MRLVWEEGWVHFISTDKTQFNFLRSTQDLSPCINPTTTSPFLFVGFEEPLAAATSVDQARVGSTSARLNETTQDRTQGRRLRVLRPSCLHAQDTACRHRHNFPIRRERHIDACVPITEEQHETGWSPAVYPM